MFVLGGWGGRERAWYFIIYDIGKEKTACHNFGSCPLFALQNFVTEKGTTPDIVAPLSGCPIS